MIRRNSGADSIVWIEEGNSTDSVWDVVWIRAPKTVNVFGIFLKQIHAPQTGLLPVFTPRSSIYAEAFFVVEMTLAVILLLERSPVFGQGIALSLRKL